MRSLASSSLSAGLFLSSLVSAVTTAPGGPESINTVASSLVPGSSSVAATASATTISSAYPSSTVSNTQCVKGVHIIVARASDEPPGEGIIGAVANQVTTLIPDSDSLPVVYPATFENYLPSEQEGVSAMKALVKQYGDACPDGDMVLMGYSQGAQVVGDTLIGADDKYFPTNATIDGPLATKYLSQIVAVIMMGDPSHLPNQTYDVGNSTKTGLFPRLNANLFTTLGLAPKMQSYCDFNDTYCDSGSSGAVHAGYVAEYGNQAAQFVVSKFAAVAKNSSSSSTTATVAATATGASTGASTGSPSSSVSSGAAVPLATEGAFRVAGMVGGAVLMAAVAFA